MAKLDFSALNKLAYKGFETEEEREKKDALIEQGFTIVDDKDNPFLQATETASEPPQASALDDTSAAPQKPTQGKNEAFTDVSGTRNYKALYRAAHDFHRRHSPPIVEREYWRTHTVGEDDTPQAEIDYWEEVTDDIAATANAFNNDPFLNELLVDVYGELERQYYSLRGDSKSITKV